MHANVGRELGKNSVLEKTHGMLSTVPLENHTMAALLLVALACCVSAHNDRETITKTSNVFTPSSHSGWFARTLFERADAAEIPKAAGESSSSSASSSSAASANATGCDGTALDDGTGACGTCTDEFTTQCGALPVLVVALVAVLALIV